MRIGSNRLAIVLCTAAILVGSLQAVEARTQKPALHASTGWGHRQAAGRDGRAMIFQKGGNAVDAAGAMMPRPPPCGHALPAAARTGS